MPLTIAARLDSGWVAAELDAFVWRIIGLVLLISGFVSAVIIAILGRSVLLPLLRLRASLVAACDDPAQADTFVWSAARTTRSARRWSRPTACSAGSRESTAKSWRP